MLKGNLAPDGCVKQSAVAPEMMVHQGPARVYNSEEEAIADIYARRSTPGRGGHPLRGPKGSPGMREMLNPTSAICGMGLGSPWPSSPTAEVLRATRGFHRPCEPRGRCRRPHRPGGGGT